MKENRRDFDKAAQTWDENPARVKLAQSIAAAILSQVPVDKSMDALDYGCGTGLVTLELQPHVKSITGADSSAGMLSILEEKIRAFGLANVRTLLLDLERDAPPAREFDLIVTSMALHHMADTVRIIRAFHTMLRPGGYLALADLDKEYRSFHEDNTGVMHLGFSRDEIKSIMSGAGFADLKDSTAAARTKQVEGWGEVSYPIFLISGRKV
jgi:ubiquinone/menaquinone biosynthesis C-methylase UbiE